MKLQKFKVLSLDGGGIRGIFPAVILSEIERELKERNEEQWQIYQRVNLIFGTSTGGILGLALSLGIPAEEIKKMYFENAHLIFGGKKKFPKWLWQSSHSRDNLHNLLNDIFKKYNNNFPPKLRDCKIPVAVSIYDLHIGRPSVLKSSYHPRFTRDPNLPILQAALSTSSAPTYFDPYSADSYQDSLGADIKFTHKVDGGVWANNPALIALIEAQKAFQIELKNINLISIGTGERIFVEEDKIKDFGLWYWLNNKRKRIIELFMQGQSQQVENLISLLQRGIDRQEPENFGYIRLNTIFKSEIENIDMDEVNQDKLKELEQRALIQFKNNRKKIFELLEIDLD